MTESKRFDIAWITDRIYHHTIVKAPTVELAKKQFYAMASKKAMVVKIEELFVLKLKPEVDFYELTKFGLQYDDIDKIWRKFLAESDCDLCVSENSRTIYYENASCADLTGPSTALLVALYDLVAAGMVEKI